LAIHTTLTMCSLRDRNQFISRHLISSSIEEYNNYILNALTQKETLLKPVFGSMFSPRISILHIQGSLKSGHLFSSAHIPFMYLVGIMYDSLWIVNYY